jgi:hypothetical protein
MKVLQLLALAVVALANASISVSAEPKQLYHVTAPKSVFDAHLRAHGDLDVWHIKSAGDGKVKADIYATEAEVAIFQGNPNGRSRIFANQTLIMRDPVNTEELLQTREVARAACSKGSGKRFLEEIAATKYVDNAFFDCFRQPSEVFAFLDQLVTENPKIFSKIPQIAKTIEGRVIPGYKISTGKGRKPLYTQGLIHAREWIAGSSTFYTMAALLDGLRANDPVVTAIFNEYEWHFVPILNLDGYQYTWTTTRLWRKNRRPVFGSMFGVDINRNYPPVAFWDKDDASPQQEDYGGSGVLSEPETAGSWDYVKKLNIYGAIDMHSYGGQVLRAYGNQKGTPPAPYGPKLKVLGDAMAKAAGSAYSSILSAELYVAYGCFDDAVFQELNKPAFTIEMAGTSFIASESTIRPAGLNMFRAFIAFAQGMGTYWSGLPQ